MADLADALRTGRAVPAVIDLDDRRLTGTFTLSPDGTTGTFVPATADGQPPPGAVAMALYHGISP